MKRPSKPMVFMTKALKVASQSTLGISGFVARFANEYFNNIILVELLLLFDTRDTFGVKRTQ